MFSIAFDYSPHQRFGKTNTRNDPRLPFSPGPLWGLKRWSAARGRVAISATPDAEADYRLQEGVTPVNTKSLAASVVVPVKVTSVTAAAEPVPSMSTLSSPALKSNWA